MLSNQDLIKMIFGFKLKYLRQQKNLSYQQLADLTGLSTSYLHDLEKGKKYPKVDKISTLAQALGVNYDFLVSMRADKKLQPIIDLLSSEFLKEFPLETFGLSAEGLFELFSTAPDKVTAFVSTILKITRNYQMQREHIFLAALRSYQDMFDNYFGDLEEAVQQLRLGHKIPGKSPLSMEVLEKTLENLGVKIDRNTLPKQKELKDKRSYFSSTKKILYLNTELSSAQEKFLIGREIAFQYLQLQPRPYLTRLNEVESFEALLHNFKASYFAVALLMDEQQVTQDIRGIAGAPSWQPKLFLALLNKYDVTPEMLMQRLTNILPHHFGLKDLFFIRLIGEQDLRYFRMSKELHLSQLHSPYANELSEHYCRRWVSVNIIKNMRAQQQIEGKHSPIAEAQISSYWETTNEYLCISIAKIDPHAPNNPVSVTVGLLVNDELRRHFRFLDDVDLSKRTVNTTCERCNIPNCEARSVPPRIVEQRNKLEREKKALEALD